MSAKNPLRKIITLEQFIIEREAEMLASGSFSQLLRDIGLASKIVNREVNKAGLVDILGFTGDVNIQGEEVQKLDMFAHNTFVEALSIGGQVSVIASEEENEVIPVTNLQSQNAPYVVLLDPLDGSSNIDVNVSIGTIFSIYKRKSQGGAGTLNDCLQRGLDQVAAGYVIYGSSTMLVYSTGSGVNGFTLDPSIGEFLLSHKDIRIPESCNFYSLNEGNYRKFFPGIKEYLRHIKGKFDPGMKPYSSRYIGSLVADIHRNLLRGGIFIYPGLVDRPQGKLRLLYEANPMAFLVEQAGGMATDGHGRILEIQAERLHQRTPLFAGNKAEVNLLHTFLRRYESNDNNVKYFQR